MGTWKSCWFSILIMLVFLTDEFSKSKGVLPNSSCLRRERQALIKFKKGLHYHLSGVSSWVGEDCCAWFGVGCDNTTGHVLKLNLHSSELSGEVNPFLLDLKHLNYLDLSGNTFLGEIPSFLGSMKNLRYLNLSSSLFSGVVPRHLGNLSSLKQLDLGGNPNLIIDNLQWLSHLSSLQHLDLSTAMFQRVSGWLYIINMLPSLSKLFLSDCHLGDIPIPLLHVNLTSLRVLDLSGNGFNSTVPRWLLNLTDLEQLDLSENEFKGEIPSTLQELSNFLPSLSELFLSDSGLLAANIPSPTAHHINFTSLAVLDLSGNGFNSTIPRWLFNLTNLEQTDLSRNEFKGEIPSTLQELSNSLPSLSEVFLSECGLAASILIPPLHVNLTSLVVLDLSRNGFNSIIPAWLFDLTNLEQLDLSENGFEGKVPSTLKDLCNLRKLDLSQNRLRGEIFEFLGPSLEYIYLSFNSFSGQIPASLELFSSLKSLDLYSNNFSGTVPKSLGQLSELEILDISNNSLNGVLSELHFTNLVKLKVLAISSNSLKLNVSLEWSPPFQLQSIRMASCKLGPGFPLWLQTQKILFVLDMSNTNISGTIPDWFPSIADTIWYLDLSNNLISGHIPSSMGYFLPEMLFLILSDNRITGSIPVSFCKARKLMFLDLSNNQLSGQLLQCWENFDYLFMLDLASNNLSGQISSSMGSLHGLVSLHLSKNNFCEEIPFALNNLTKLIILDLGENELSGRIPPWMGKNLTNLHILRLGSNNFHGGIPPQLCQVEHLQILDLAHNNLSGTIPRCFGNLTAMVLNPNTTKDILNLDFGNLHVVMDGAFHWNQRNLDDRLLKFSYDEKIDVSTKGRQLEYTKTLSLLTSLDLSNNNLGGEIPEELTNLHGLQSLNLSENHLIGRIPKNIDRLTSLESLDLSRNQLSGGIPPNVSALHFLGRLNLSFNNLSGPIPLTGQLETLDDSSIYMGNPDLCGAPTGRRCTGLDLVNNGTELVGSPSGKGDDDEDEALWFYIGLAAGFVVGFLGVCINLLLNKSWRNAWFRFCVTVGK
ncbi:PREDICTED: LRR receptor-like serine/threonine-protein kinase GSO2 [Nelumbo nucifera]|uniref:LRR receptor-like serine/threonine-protein kinase GSO2 n=1 Tax=Nelumbo nucifera TaxID=4432 RepID=A0A1U7ZXT2_NELNU|nr:PREDICTED: LRR receptor-like serine/threonine-protein kinase GSO2 [Nelumbo nucifera]